MYEKFSKTIQDVHKATGIPEDGSGQRLIRDPLRFGELGVEGKDWVKKGSHIRAPFGLTEEFFDRYVKFLKNRHNL